jgi:tellurite resistance-related uncharacterized protein
MVKLTDWIQGEHVTWKEFKGYVNFISESYITICIREYDKPEHVAKHSKMKTNQVCLLVFPQYWHQVERTGSK